jgi:hypothetical protein
MVERTDRFVEKQQFARLKRRLIKKAVMAYGSIFPCGFCKELEDCFTRQGNEICFWFMTEDKNTHMIRETIIKSFWSNLTEWYAGSWN